jgi:hypothetical protein
MHSAASATSFMEQYCLYSSYARCITAQPPVGLANGGIRACRGWPTRAALLALAHPVGAELWRSRRGAAPAKAAAVQRVQTGALDGRRELWSHRTLRER